jgi:hypothetical protein
LTCFSNLKMEATCSPETSGDFQRTTQRYIPDDERFQSESCTECWSVSLKERVH